MLVSGNRIDAYDQLLSKTYSLVSVHCLTINYKMAEGQTLNVKTLDSDGKITVLCTLSSPRGKPEDLQLKRAAATRAVLERYSMLLTL